MVSAKQAGGKGMNANQKKAMKDGYQAMVKLLQENRKQEVEFHAANVAEKKKKGAK